MPFKAYLENEIKISSFISKEEWDEIKKHKPSIKMCCCDNPGYMKRNKYGTQYFVHKKRGDCNSQPESKEHILLKDKIAKFCKKSNCDLVDVERVGPDWKADVYVENQQRKYAFEVQLSNISIDTLKERSKKYVRDGIQPVWIIKKFKYFEENHKRKSLFLDSISHYLVLDDYLFHLKNDGIVINTLNNYDSMLDNDIFIDTINENVVSISVFLDRIIFGTYVPDCFSQIAQVCNEYDLLKEESLKRKLEDEINLQKPDIYSYGEGKFSICPNCSGKLKRECINYNDHYYQVGIRCIECHHFEGIEDNFDFEDTCQDCGSELLVGDAKKDSANNMYEIGTLCLNCKSFNLLHKGNFAPLVEEYVRKGIEFRKRLRRS